MKKQVFYILILSICILIACKNETKKAEEMAPATQTETTASADTSTQALVYACPMHPEEKGKAGDACPKCKMALVAEKETKHDEHAGHNH
jgi:hypothetical protein